MISPDTADVVPRGTLPFTALGAPGPYRFELSTNASGGSVDDSGNYTAGATGGVSDVLTVTAANGKTGSATIQVGPGLTPKRATPVVRLGKLVLSATGGSGHGNKWSFVSNHSGGKLDAAGNYTAGATGGATDTVRVTDSLGNQTTQDLHVIGLVDLQPPYSDVKAGAPLTFSVAKPNGALTFALAGAESGGTLDAAGHYKAGANSGIDVVTVTDANGNLGTAAVRVTASNGYTPAAHATRMIPLQGGDTLANPILVTITYTGDRYGADIHKLGDYLARSRWLTQGGAEYGVFWADHIAVTLPDPAPRTISDDEIQTNLAGWITDKTIPSGAGAKFFYVVALPGTTTETLRGNKLCDFSGGGYHGEATSNEGGTFSYSVISPCPDPMYKALQTLQITMSHEFIEACTNPLPESNPAYTMDRQSGDVWATLGGEVGDLCNFSPAVVVDGNTLTTIYSNTAAASGGAPCVPGNAPFYSVSASPGTFVVASAGQTVTFSLEGWSSTKQSPWTLYADSGTTGFGQDFTPDIKLAATQIANGQKTTMTVTVPPNTPSMSSSVIYIASYQDRSRIFYELAGVYVR